MKKKAIEEITVYCKEKFPERGSSQRKIGIELKFPVVDREGKAVSYNVIRELWAFLQEYGWKGITDRYTNEVVGVKKEGNIISNETGYCKLEISLSPEKNLIKISNKLNPILKRLTLFSKKDQIHILGYGIQPITPPSKKLYIKKERTLFWEKLFPSNKIIEKKDGCDVHLFTVNASNQCHVEVDSREAVEALNIFNGLSGAQIALNGHSPIWKGGIDPRYKAASEILWDWWLPGENRTGMPKKRFDSLEDYIRTILNFKPIFIKRDGKVFPLSAFSSFKNYYISKDGFFGKTTEGDYSLIVPEIEDIDLHQTFVWYDARLTRYGTIENRLNCEQPPEELMAISALTLGLVENLSKAKSLLSRYRWEDLKKARIDAIEKTLKAEIAGRPIIELCKEMVLLAKEGLLKRGLGEEKFLGPFWLRLKKKESPADKALKTFNKGGIKGLLKNLSLDYE